MKVQVSQLTMSHLLSVCRLREHTQFIGKPFVKLMVDEELDKVERQCLSKKAQKKATLNLTAAQLVCLEAISAPVYSNPSVLIVIENIFKPILQKQS